MFVGGECSFVFFVGEEAEVACGDAVEVVADDFDFSRGVAFFVEGAVQFVCFFADFFDSVRVVHDLNPIPRVVIGCELIKDGWRFFSCKRRFFETGTL